MGIIDKLNKDFESRIRLGLMSVLMVNDWMTLQSKALLNTTDGNLAIVKQKIKTMKVKLKLMILPMKLV
jgi:hypothetical protein